MNLLSFLEVSNTISIYSNTSLYHYDISNSYHKGYKDVYILALQSKVDFSNQIFISSVQYNQLLVVEPNNLKNFLAGLNKELNFFNNIDILFEYLQNIFTTNDKYSLFMDIRTLPNTSVIDFSNLKRIETQFV